MKIDEEGRIVLMLEKVQISSDHERIKETSHKALYQIEKLGLKPVPQIYELWFRYFQGDPEIVNGVDSQKGIIIDETFCHKLYRRHLSETAKDAAVQKISDQVQLAIVELAAMLNSIKSATSEYGENLGDVSEKVKGAKSLNDLGTIVSDIIEDTKQMVKKNHDLEFQLVSSSTQVAELKKNLDNVKKEAMTDGLTGLSNRKAFDKQIHDWTEEVNTTGAKLSLLMLDIDHFKKFNDLHGHQTGDQILRLVARTMIDGLKGRDMAARFGGEEFAVILPDTPTIGAVTVAETLRKAIANKEIVNKKNNVNLGQITISIGVAEYITGESVAEFIERADVALYEAKNSGRNKVRTAAAAK